MLVNPDGTIWLVKGEVIPVVCRCGQVYQPPLHSEWSTCPRCEREVVHGTLTVRLVALPS